MVPPHVKIKDQHGNWLTEMPAIPDFGCSNVEEQFMDVVEYHPERVVPSAADSLAVIITEVEASPLDWAKLVIDDFYDLGLRFLFLLYDPSDGGPDLCRNVFYSGPDDQADFKIEGGHHCYGVTAGLPSFIEMLEREEQGLPIGPELRESYSRELAEILDPEFGSETV
jgi:hypothetical protein